MMTQRRGQALLASSMNNVEGDLPVNAGDWVGQAGDDVRPLIHWELIDLLQFYLAATFGERAAHLSE